MLRDRRAEHRGSDPTGRLGETENQRRSVGRSWRRKGEGAQPHRAVRKTRNRDARRGSEGGWVGGEITLKPGREAGGGVAAAAAGPSSDQASRPAVEACVFRTGTALSMPLSLSLALASLARVSCFELRVLCSALLLGQWPHFSLGVLALGQSHSFIAGTYLLRNSFFSLLLNNLSKLMM